MASGTVKWFNTAKGFGFAQPDDGGSDVFIHISALNQAGLDSLDEGDKVDYELEQDRRSGKLEITGPGGREWEVTALPDGLPTIAVTGEMGREADDRFKQKFTATDDYGVVAGRVTGVGAGLFVVHYVCRRLGRVSEFGVSLRRRAVADLSGSCPCTIRG